MTRDELLQTMVNRFLGWPLPKDFAPDSGISFDGRPPESPSWPIGTSLFTADQAMVMFRHCLPPEEAK